MIPTPSPLMKIQIIGGKLYLGDKAKHCWALSSNFCKKKMLTFPSNVLPLHLKKTFRSIIWILTEGEGDWIKSRLPFIIFSSLSIIFSFLINFIFSFGLIPNYNDFWFRFFTINDCFFFNSFIFSLAVLEVTLYQWCSWMWEICW